MGKSKADLAAPVHDPKPVILAADAVPEWLDVDRPADRYTPPK